MVSPEKIKLIIQNNNFIIMNICPFDERYYLEMGTNSYDIFLLGQLLAHLRFKYKSNKNIAHDLKTRQFISTVNDLEYYAGRYDPKTNLLYIHGEYDDYQDQAYFEKVFPKDKSKDFLEHEYPVPLDIFLKLAEKMQLLFNKRTLWIVLYEDDQGSLHLEKYDKNLDFLKTKPLTPPS